MTQTPIPKLITQLGIPTTISMLVTNIYNMADTYFVGKEGTSASGAIGIVFGLMAVIQAFGFMFGHGAGSIIARKLGARDSEGAGRYASTSFAASFAAGLLITVLGFLFLNPFLHLLGSTDTILPYSRIYASFILAAAPFMCSSCVMNNILRYEGRAFYAMIGLSLGGILNIFGDWYLMRILHMGVAGAGLSTALSQLVSFFVLMVPFFRGVTQSRLSLRRITKDPADLCRIMSTGLPSLIRQGMNSLSTMVLNNAAGAYGDAAVAAMSIVGRLQFFLFAVALGIGQGFQPVSAFNYGARKYKRLRDAFWFTTITGGVMLTMAACVCYSFSGSLIRIFRDDPQVVSIGTPALHYMLIALLFQPVCVCGSMLFQSIGKNVTASFLSMLRSGLYLIPTLIVLPRFIGLQGVQMASMIGDILTFFTTIPFLTAFFRILPRRDQTDTAA